VDFLAAYEDLAANVATFDFADDDSQISDSDWSLCQILFNRSSDETAKANRDWRADVARLTISKEAWLLEKETKIVRFNKESYEYSLYKAQKAKHRVHIPCHI
jgi:hypothetical protein